MNLNKCIKEFVDNISVTDRQEENIECSFNNLKTNLLKEESGLEVKDVFLNGSYARDTIIRPLDDIDLFAVIDFDDYQDNWKNPNPQTVLTNFKKYLNGIVDYKDKVKQDRPCVTIVLSNKNFDVLPTLRKSGMYFIPNYDLTDWTFTDPDTHTTQLEEIHKNNKKIKPVIKAVKYWKRESDIKIPSFHVEEIAMSVFGVYNVTTLEEGIRRWYEYGVNAIRRDRFNTQNQYDDAQSSIKDVRDKLNEAKELLDNSKESEAKGIWKEVFGKEFPVLDEAEARSFADSLSQGKLKHSVAAGLSTVSGTAVAASKGFYGKEEK